MPGNAFFCDKIGHTPNACRIIINLTDKQKVLF